MKNIKQNTTGIIAKAIFTLSLMLVSISGFSQDLVYRLDGTVVKAKVTEVNTYSVVYHRHNNPDGPVYNAPKTDLIKIVYEDGGEDIFNKNAAKKLEKSTTIDEDGNKVVDFSTSKYLFVELLGTGGILSINYEGKMATFADGNARLYARAGAGFSNKGIYMPHGISIGVGSEKHQFEFGAQGTIITRFQEYDAFSFLHGDGTLRYTFGPSFGYRYQSETGFFAKAGIPLIISKDSYYPESGWRERWGMTPWFNVALGFGF